MLYFDVQRGVAEEQKGGNLKTFGKLLESYLLEFISKN